jgi:hypothetical protein
MTLSKIILEKNIENLTDKMELTEKIDLLEDEIIELKYQLKKSRDKEYVYLDILSTIEESLKVFFKEEEENKRFGLNDAIDYRECIVNLKKSLDEYKRTNNLRF